VKLRTTLLKLTVLAASCLASLAAAEVPMASLGTMSLEELMEIEITSASKRSMKVSETPATIAVITAEDISTFGYRNLAEALQRVVGFYVSNDQNYEYLGVRGFSRPGDFNSRILVLVDGHRINDPIYDEGAVGNHFPLDINDIERIEIVKGPGSAVWGSNALLAVINVFTKKGGAFDGGRVIGEVGTFDTRKATIQYGKELESGADIAMSYSGSLSNGQRSFYYKEFDDGGITSDGFSIGTDDESYHHGYFSAKYEGFSFLLFGGARKKIVPTASYGTDFNSDDMYTVDESVRVEVSYERELAGVENGRVYARAGYDDVEYNGQYRYGSSPESFLYRDRSTSRRLGGEVRASGDPYDGLTLTLGTESYRLYDLQNSAWFATPEYALDSFTDNSLTYFGVYLEGALDLTQDLKLFLGGRVDDYSTFGSNFSPRIGFTYAASEVFTVRGQYGNAFRAPNDYELNFESGSIAPNRDLNPETIDNYEIIFDYRLSRGASVSTSIFYYKMAELIAQEVGGDGRTVFLNGEDVSAAGVELSGNYELGDRARGFVGFSYVETGADDAGQLVNSPHSTANIGLAFGLPLDSLTMAPECRYIGSRRTLQGARIEGYPICNITLRYKTEDSPIEATLGMYNIFDRDTSSVSGNEHVQDRIQNYGRQLRATMSYEF
jgi:outer membrane receptor protein involved in Fe transport